ncbi:MAG: signal transduction protein [Herbinix sp.]|jgi:CheY-like chemotaxis protein|nr:signal transduction protein [Herbinix sp.]
MSEGMKRILIVDDEVQILRTLSRLFLDTDYEAITAENGADALHLLEMTEVDLIISDMRMPLLDGYELLNQVKEKYPKIIRIILSGYAEESIMFKALLHNVARIYIFKPWNNTELMANLDHLFATDALLHSNEVSLLIEDIKESPVILPNCQKLVSLAEEENLDNLINEISADPVVSELLLQVAKTAIYGAMPSNVKQVAIYIGLRNLKCFLYWASVTNCDPLNDLAGSDMELLWKHSCYTNKFLLFIYESFLHKQPPEAALFSGLLHNTGFIILYKNLLAKQDGENKIIDLLTLEKGDLKVTHQQVGGYFLNSWDLPYPTVEAALYHHNPLEQNIVNFELVACVHLAQHYAWISLEKEDTNDFYPEVIERLGISKEIFDKKLAQFSKKI